MARRRSRRRKQSSFGLAWIAIALLSGGGIGGYINPDLPILGALVQIFRSVGTGDVLQSQGNDNSGSAPWQNFPNAGSDQAGTGYSSDPGYSGNGYSGNSYSWGTTSTATNGTANQNPTHRQPNASQTPPNYYGTNGYAGNVTGNPPAAAGSYPGANQVPNAYSNSGNTSQQQPGGPGTPASFTSSNSPQQIQSLLIATFNIQVFGTSKLSKPRVVDVLAQIVRQFDVIAIQEIRSKDDSILPRFLSVVNSTGRRYSFVISPRLGRTTSTEQYAFIFDTDRIALEPSSVGTMSDPADVLHREPFAARFQVRTPPSQPGFSFWLVNIHTDPDEVPQEVAVLADAYQIMQSANPAEDDVILLGDLNANERQFGRLGTVPGVRWVVSGNVMTNTRKTKAYDNILFHGERTSEFTGRWGVIDIESVFRLTRQEALQVSDHLPVWAEFTPYERSRNATAPFFSRRY